MRAVLAVPLISRGHTWRALDLYWRRDHEPDERDRVSSQLLANVPVSYQVITDARNQAKAAQDLLVHRALHDQLTGLPNRDLIGQLIEQALAAAVRRGSFVSVIFLDIDHFKTINDNFGHHAGDQVLQVVAHRLQNVLRVGDNVGRISGDEFLIVCDDIAVQREDSADLLVILGQRIRAAVAEPVTLVDVDQPVTVTASVGIACSAQHDPAVSADALTRAAHAALYQAKASGRNGFTVQQ